jgi:acyl-CoA synthetase (AMP-forming)/AMP-acid ligase II
LNSAQSISEPEFATFAHAVRWWAAREPGTPAFTALPDGEREGHSLTYGELDREARRLACSLQVNGGDRVVLCFTTGAEFVVAFLACHYAGVVPVPVNPPQFARHVGRLDGVLDDSGAALVLTDAQTAEVAGRPWQVVVLGDESSTGWEPALPGPGDIAFLQYTSGSTAAPKGVVVTHRNLAANVAMMRIPGHRPRPRVVTWLPLHHDMGLIGCLLMPLWRGGFVAAMPPIAFLRDPMRWPRAMSHYGATMAHGPNFGYELCSRRAEPDEVAALDLSTLDALGNGAEPVRLATLDRFAELFAPAGLRRSVFWPCYGLAEATLMVTGEHLPDEAALELDRESLGAGVAVPARPGSPSTTLVSCGPAAAGANVVIMDGDRECGPGEVGEIRVAGDHVARGYWNNPQATEETFGTGLLRTGDLGFLRDERLYITGRIKDLVIIHGTNHYPQDIEATVEQHPAVRAGTSIAYATEAAGAEGIGLVAEISPRHDEDELRRIAGEIATTVREVHQAGVAQLVLVKPGSLPKTSSGKPRRHLTRDQAAAGELPELLRWPGRSAQPYAPLRVNAAELAALSPADAEREITTIVRGEVAAVLALASPGLLDPGLRLDAIGLDSLGVVHLRNRLGSALELELPVDAVRDATIETLARTVHRALLVRLTTADRGDDAEFEQEEL